MNRKRSEKDLEIVNNFKEDIKQNQRYRKFNNVCRFNQVNQMETQFQQQQKLQQRDELRQEMMRVLELKRKQKLHGKERAQKNKYEIAQMKEYYL